MGNDIKFQVGDKFTCMTNAETFEIEYIGDITNKGKANDIRMRRSNKDYPVCNMSQEALKRFINEKIFIRI